jgi:pimeloyl-ACP methyl ester carboxylesterase
MQKSVSSQDGVEIAYELSGQGNEALVFVHGWLGNGHWWDEQRKAFEASYQIISLDLAGHGRSGKLRKTWSIDAYAEDIKAVVQDSGVKACHLVGHSMSGSNVIAASLLLGTRVKSIILVDTLLDLDSMPTPNEVQPMFEGLKANYKGTMEHALEQFLLVPASPEPVRERIKKEFLAADPQLAIDVLIPFYQTDIRSKASEVKVPVRAINSDMRPTNATANRKYLRNFDFKVISDVGHYPMLESPQVFNQLLQETLSEL